MLCPYLFMAQLRRSLGLVDGLAMVVGIMVGSGIFRTPGLVAAYLGRPSLTFVAWILGGVVALLGALCFAELSTRHPAAGGKYVYVREAFGPRAAPRGRSPGAAARAGARPCPPLPPESRRSPPWRSRSRRWCGPTTATSTWRRSLKR